MKESKNPFVSMYKGFKNIFKGKKKDKTPAVQEEALMDMTNISPIVNNTQTSNATQPITPQQDSLAGIKQREHKKDIKPKQQQEEKLLVSFLLKVLMIVFTF